MEECKVFKPLILWVVPELSSRSPSWLPVRTARQDRSSCAPCTLFFVLCVFFPALFCAAHYYILCTDPLFCAPLLNCTILHLCRALLCALHRSKLCAVHQTRCSQMMLSTVEVAMEEFDCKWATTAPQGNEALHGGSLPLLWATSLSPNVSILTFFARLWCPHFLPSPSCFYWAA